MKYETWKWFSGNVGAIVTVYAPDLMFIEIISE